MTDTDQIKTVLPGDYSSAVALAAGGILPAEWETLLLLTGKTASEFISDVDNARLVALQIQVQQVLVTQAAIADALTEILARLNKENP